MSERWSGYLAHTRKSEETVSQGSCDLPPDLVELLAQATPEQVQEAADLAYLHRDQKLQLSVWFSSGSWWAEAKGIGSFPGDTRALALHALAEKVKGERP